MFFGFLDFVSWIRTDPDLDLNYPDPLDPDLDLNYPDPSDPDSITTFLNSFIFWSIFSEILPNFC